MASNGLPSALSTHQSLRRIPQPLIVKSHEACGARLTNFPRAAQIRARRTWPRDCWPSTELLEHLAPIIPTPSIIAGPNGERPPLGALRVATRAPTLYPGGKI